MSRERLENKLQKLKNSNKVEVNRGDSTELGYEYVIYKDDNIMLDIPIVSQTPVVNHIGTNF